MNETDAHVVLRQRRIVFLCGAQIIVYRADSFRSCKATPRHHKGQHRAAGSLILRQAGDFQQGQCVITQIERITQRFHRQRPFFHSGQFEEVRLRT